MEMNLHPTPKKEWQMTQEEFSKFLAWLHPDRDRAGETYEKIRHRLIKIFVSRTCTNSEELADETINRVVRKIQEIADNYVGERIPYFIAVANKIHLEYLRKKPVPQTLPLLESSSWAEEEYDCLEECMEHLTQRSKELVLEYYREEKHEKINLRKQQADKLDIPLNALRIRACRIRAKLESCVIDCLRQRAAV
jgi:DNA-directed RNA polymerase specialized sigma24 family protein